MTGCNVSNSIFFISLEHTQVIQEQLSELTRPVYTRIHITRAYIPSHLGIYSLIWYSKDFSRDMRHKTPGSVYFWQMYTTNGRTSRVNITQFCRKWLKLLTLTKNLATETNHMLASFTILDLELLSSSL